MKFLIGVLIILSLNFASAVEYKDKGGSNMIDKLSLMSEASCWAGAAAALKISNAKPLTKDQVLTLADFCAKSLENLKNGN